MALLPTVLDFLADYGLHERATWDSMARVLRSEGMLSPSKRGFGAKDVPFSDVSTLVLAGLATSSPARAADAARTYQRLSLRKIPSTSHGFAFFDELATMPTFGDALDYVLVNARQISDEMFERDEKDRQLGDRFGYQLEIVVERPFTAAMVSLIRTAYGAGGWSVQDQVLDLVWGELTTDVSPLHGMKVISEVDFGVIGRLSDLVAGLEYRFIRWTPAEEGGVR